MAAQGGSAPSYTTRGCDGYWDFIGVEDLYFGTIQNKIDNSDYICQTYEYKSNSGASSDSSFGIHDGVMFSGSSYYLGGTGYLYETKIYNSQTNAFYRSYPHTIEVYSKIIATGTDCGIITTRVSDDKLTNGVGTSFYINSTSELKTSGAVGQGNSTFTVNTIDLSVYHHWVLELNSKLIKVYLDGVLVGSASPTNNSIGSRTTRLVPCPNGKTNYKSELKMVRIYSVLLTDQEVLDNYNQTINTYI